MTSRSRRPIVRCHSRVLGRGRQPVERRVRGADDDLGPPDGALDAAVARELPGRHALGAGGVRDRVLREVLVHLPVHAVERERVARAGGDVQVAGLGDRRRCRGGREDRVHDEVDRDDVEHRVGHAGEVGQLAATERDDQRVGDLEAVDPAGERVLQRALDDARAHDGEPVLRAPQLFGGPLGERLRQRVDVGPAQALRAGAAGDHEPVLDPVDARGLGGLRDGAGALLAVRGAGAQPSARGARRTRGCAARRAGGRPRRRSTRRASRRRGRGTPPAARPCGRRRRSRWRRGRRADPRRSRAAPRRSRGRRRRSSRTPRRSAGRTTRSTRCGSRRRGRRAARGRRRGSPRSRRRARRRSARPRRGRPPPATT